MSAQCERGLSDSRVILPRTHELYLARRAPPAASGMPLPPPGAGVPCITPRAAASDGQARLTRVVAAGEGRVVPLSSYGVLVGRVVDRRREPDGDSPHFQLRLIDDDAVHYRAAINVRSQQEPSELLYLVDDDLRHPVTAAAGVLPWGWHRLAATSGGPNLDYIRANLVDRRAMRALPPDADGPDNDLEDLLDHYVQRAEADPDARALVFGQRWPTEGGVPDKIFGFVPGNGVHDVHMNQGNSGSFRQDDGVWQDGGLLLHLPAESRWIGIFLAFQNQAWHTDDTTGHALPDVPVVDARVRALAALVNPIGPAPEHERVLLLNASPEPVDLTGWRMADAQQRTWPLPQRALDPGDAVWVDVGEGAQLGNKGGTITLLDQHGLKVHGVAYTADQADAEGWTLTF
jgi:uncharacterized protein YukJ